MFSRPTFIINYAYILCCVYRGHSSTLYIGQSYQVDLPELINRTETIRVARFRDEGTDYANVEDNLSEVAIESHNDVKQMAAITNELYGNFSFLLNIVA